MATLVTGGTGFVASNIVKTLAEHGHQVVSFDLVAPDAMVQKYLEPWLDKVTFIQGDIRDTRDLEQVAEHNINKIVHAAVYTALRPDIEKGQSRSIVDINVAGTANLLDLACHLSLERFLYVSSGAVYGEGRSIDEVLREDIILYPRTLYAVTKYASELLTRRYGELHSIPTVSVRLSSPYGPMERVTGHRALMSVLYQWAGSVVRGEPIQVSDSSLGQEFTYVADIASGICTVLDAPSLSYDEYNISSGRWRTLDEIIGVFRELRPNLQVEDAPSGEFGILRRERMRGPMDVTRLREDVGFTAGYDLTSGISEYLDWRETFPFHD